MAPTFGGTDDWAFTRKSNGDLVGILKGPISGGGKTELHIPSAASYYQSCALQIGTGMALTFDRTDECVCTWKPDADLVGILKGLVSRSGKT
eukprot:142883-Karenia_brevis.AAC.1